MNKKIITLEVTKKGPGELETMMAINGDPADVAFALSELILTVNDCMNGSGMMKVDNGFWLMLQEHVNDELKARVSK